MNDFKIYDINSFNYKQIYNIKTVRRTKGNQGTKARGKILDIVCAFDIETTYIKEIDNAIMYIWQFQFGPDKTIIGRTWEEFIDFLQRLKRCMNGRKLIVYIHNASYEFSFLKGIYTFEPDEVFAIEARRVLKFSMFNAFEFRCSYLLSNMSLEKFLKEMQVEHKKQANFDYKKLRYPWTALSDEEMLYCSNDVRGLVEAIYKRLEKDHDNLYSIPLTSTGYVRRDCKHIPHACGGEPLWALDMPIYRIRRFPIGMDSEALLLRQLSNAARFLIMLQIEACRLSPCLMVIILAYRVNRLI